MSNQSSIRETLKELYDQGAFEDRLRDKQITSLLVDSIYDATVAKREQEDLVNSGVPLSALSIEDYDLPSSISVDGPGSAYNQNSPNPSTCPSLTIQIGLNPSNGTTEKIPSMYFKGYDHATWYVSNAKQTASYFVCCLGFSYLAYKGLETGCKLSASHVVKNGNVVLEFLSPLISSAVDDFENAYIQEIHKFIHRHGDGVRDVSFEVDNLDYVYQCAIKAGAKSVSAPSTLKDRFGKVRVATIEVFDDVHHTLVEKNSNDYRGPFLPGYEAHPLLNQQITKTLMCFPPVYLNKIDHCVQNEDWNKLEEACDVYKKIFGFHEFWSVDEEDVSTEYSALRSIVMASANEEVKMPMNEPAEGVCKSQIEEFLDFYNGPGVQHIALLTDDIVQTVSHMRLRGAEFISVPKMYYENLLPRLLETGVKINEDLNDLKQLDILVDFDENGYLLQIFTKPLTDRPTFFLEIIQRNNHNGFGKGNFKALFETIELEQRLRGTLVKGSAAGISRNHD